MARKLGVLGKGIVRVLSDAANAPFRWNRLGAFVRTGKLDEVTDARRFRKLGRIADNLGTVGKHAGPANAIFLLKHVETAEDAAVLARVSRIAGKQTRNTVEVLGLGKAARAIVRLSDLAWTMIGLLAALAAQVLALLSPLCVRLVRRVYSSKAALHRQNIRTKAVMNDDLVNEVRQTLVALYRQMAPRELGTEAVKKALCEACKAINSNFYVYASGLERPPADGGEWLFDVTCLNYDSDGYLVRVPLVAESEWGTENQIYEDFEKLLLARADVRIMVFDGTRTPGYRAIFATFARYIARCERSEEGDTWLFAAWTPERFVFHRINAFQDQRDLE